MRLHNRQVKAAFWTDTDLIRLLDIAGRMFYQGLWQLADDSACLEYDILAFKIHLFPADDHITTETIQEWVDKLIKAQKLIEYKVGDKKCLFLKNFHKYQTLKNCPPPEVPLPEWITFVPFKSNDRQGKYIINYDILNNFLHSSYNKKEINKNGLQASSNQNQNQNQNKNLSIDSTSEQSPDAPPDQPDKKTKEPEKPKKPRQIPLFDEATEQYKLALFMRDCVLKNLPNAKVPEPAPDKLRRWAYDIDLMMRIDCRSPDEIRQLMDWAHRDSFWKANILSPGKLREKWDTLVAHRMRGKEKNRGDPGDIDYKKAKNSKYGW